MRYLPKSDSERRQMLDACGVESAEDLFAHLPEAVRLRRPLDLAPGISEYEIVDYFRERAAENANGYASFLGAGVYRHYRPVLADAPEKLNEDPHGAAWLVKIRLSAPGELPELMTAADYQTYIGAEK